MSSDESPRTPFGELDAFGESIGKVLVEGQRLNADGMATRSRELSLAVTKLEEAIHWVQARLMMAGLQREVFVNGEQQT